VSVAPVGGTNKFLLFLIKAPHVLKFEIVEYKKFTLPPYSLSSIRELNSYMKFVRSEYYSKWKFGYLTGNNFYIEI
jgi:hypothetical protein